MYEEACCTCGLLFCWSKSIAFLTFLLPFLPSLGWEHARLAHNIDTLVYPFTVPIDKGIECFHMTSRWPYWCPKTMKRRPCWCPEPTLWELNSFLMQTLSFDPINLHRCWPREWKHSIHWNWNRNGVPRCSESLDRPVLSSYWMIHCPSV